MTTAADIEDLLKPGLRKVSGKYKDIPKQFTKIFKTEKSTLAVERTVEMRFLALPVLKGEGQATSFDNSSGQRSVYNQEHLEVGLGFAMTRKSIDDNQYKSAYKPSTMGLMESFAQFDEIRAANVLNTGSTYDQTVVGDGVALFSTAHPTDGANQANTPSTSIDLNEQAIYSSLISIRLFQDAAGLKKLFRGQKLIVPIQQEYIACRLTMSELRPGTANNDVNALMSTGALPEGYVVMDYLTSTRAYFFETTCNEGLLNLERIAYEMDMHTDPMTGNLLVTGYQRNSFGYENWRGNYGVFPT